MNAGRIILATVLGGIAMFFWGFLAHMALPIGDMGVQSLPSDQTLIPQMQQAIKQRGFYFFPGMDKQNMSEEAEKAWMERYKQGPRGVLIHDPSGGEMMSAGQLGTEFLSNVAAALLMALVLAQVRAGMLMRTLLGAAMGVFA